jgi:hypothetical protein
MAPDNCIQLEPPLQFQLQADHDETSGSSYCSSPFAKSPNPSSPGMAELQSSNLPRYAQKVDLFLQPHPVQIFTPTDFALLNHYLEHTSKDMTVDDGDQYALQIGIPNLALQSKPLMRSMLAFSAVCKCHDIIEKSPVSPTGRRKIMDLLSTADRYHMESLRDIQPTLFNVKHYDHILANAAMMGMYGSGSHCIRIWLTETADSEDVNLGRFRPKSCQWMSLFRAVRVAYGGLLKNRRGMEDKTQFFPIPSSDTAPSVRSPQQMEPQNHPLYSILAATVVSAMTRLSEKTSEIVEESIRIRTNKCLDNHDDANLQACLTALRLLRNIVTETFPSKNIEASTPNPFDCYFEDELTPVDQIPKISAWMRRYTASITSTVPSKLPRRFIMAFIHKAPTRYLELVEDIMGFILNGGPGESLIGSPEPNLAHKLAMEIFAHWLVLVLMLDSVWWIGGIGAWELRQIVAAGRNTQWRCLWNKREDWWPGSMLEVSRQLDNYREKI